MSSILFIAIKQEAIIYSVFLQSSGLIVCQLGKHSYHAQAFPNLMITLDAGTYHFPNYNLSMY